MLSPPGKQDPVRLFPLLHDDFVDKSQDFSGLYRRSGFFTPLPKGFEDLVTPFVQGLFYLGEEIVVGGHPAVKSDVAE